MQKYILPFLNIVALLFFTWYFVGHDFFSHKMVPTAFRNLSFSGRVLEMKINKEAGEKTHTLYLSDSTVFVVPHLGLDAEIQTGDSLTKVKTDYQITIYKKDAASTKIIYALPYIE
jgi:hypothetical protein